MHGPLNSRQGGGVRFACTPTASGAMAPAPAWPCTCLGLGCSCAGAACPMHAACMTKSAARPAELGWPCWLVQLSTASPCCTSTGRVHDGAPGRAWALRAEEGPAQAGTCLRGVDDVRILQGEGEGLLQLCGKAVQRGERPAGEHDASHLHGSSQASCGPGWLWHAGRMCAGTPACGEAHVQLGPTTPWVMQPVCRRDNGSSSTAPCTQTASVASTRQHRSWGAISCVSNGDKRHVGPPPGWLQTHKTDIPADSTFFLSPPLRPPYKQ